LPGECGGATNVHAPGTHALERVLLGEHVEVPESKSGGELDVACLRVGTRCGEADGGGSLKVTVDWDAGLRVDGCRVGGGEGGWAAAADAEELNLGHDEAVAAAVFAHHAVEVSEALEVEDLLGWGFAAHAGVPLVVALDETDDAAPAVAEESLLVVGGVVGDELWLCALASDRLDGAHDHVRVALSDLESGIDLVGVVVGADVLERRLVLWLQVLAARLRKVVGRDGNLKKRKHRRNGLDGGDVEVLPAAEVADVPPEVVVDAAWCASDAANKRWGGVRRREVLN